MEYPILNLPLDETGVAESHHREETHPVLLENQFIVYPEKGAYFTDSMAVMDQNGNELKLDLDWEPILHYQEATLEVGQSIHRCFVIKQSNNVSSITSVNINYQLLGGEYCNDNIAFEQLLEWYKVKTNKVSWDDVIKPSDGFKPKLHTHNTNTDLKGTQEVVEAINQVTNVLQDFLNRHDFKISDIVGLQEQLNDLDTVDKSQSATIEQLQKDLSLLISEQTNNYLSGNGSTCLIERKSVYTIVDKEDAVGCVIQIDDNSGFKVNDTVEINVGNFNVGTVTYEFTTDGVFRDLEGNDLTTMSSTGNHYITLRCVGKSGQTTVMKIVKVS